MHAIEFDAVSKRYRIGSTTTIREAIAAGARSILRSRDGETSEFWSLRDVSFEVQTGTAVGVVGRNGAGKSTVLKILAGITAPTRGESRTAGRVAALLEVGTGFHPELTGRENVFLSGSILGMTRSDIRARFDDIVQFAGVERFLDTPAKRYSSGMYLRLAFAVAAYLDPEILVVDEILAVGDAEFQQRCLNRMHEAGKEGRTVVFVSHDLEAVRRLCARSVWLDGGRVREIGPTPDVVRSYLSDSDLMTLAGSSISAGPVVVDAVRVQSSSGAGSAVLVGDAITIGLNITLVDQRRDVDVAIYLLNRAGVRILDEAISDEAGRRLGVGRNSVRLEVPGILNAGEYSIGVWVGTEQDDFLDTPAIGTFRVVGGDPFRQERLLVLRSRFQLGAPREAGSAERGPSLEGGEPKSPQS